jgi:hypothetical protein
MVHRFIGANRTDRIKKYTAGLVLGITMILGAEAYEHAYATKKNSLEQHISQEKNAEQNTKTLPFTRLASGLVATISTIGLLYSLADEGKKYLRNKKSRYSTH